MKKKTAHTITTVNNVVIGVKKKETKRMYSRETTT